MFYAITTIFYGGNNMTYEMRKCEPTLLLIPIPYDIGMVREELAIDDAVSYTLRGKCMEAQLNTMAVTGIHTHVPAVTCPEH